VISILRNNKPFTDVDLKALWKRWKQFEAAHLYRLNLHRLAELHRETVSNNQIGSSLVTVKLARH